MSTLTRSPRIVLARALVADAQSSNVECSQYTVGVVAFSGLASGANSAVFRARIDPTNDFGWHTIGAVNAVDGVTQSNALTDGMFRVDLSPYSEFSLDLDYVAGAIDADLRMTDQ